jgi:hypothetical protein
MKIGFSINSYDQDGDMIEDGVYLHFDDTRVRVCGSPEEFGDVLNKIDSIDREIKENY